MKELWKESGMLEGWKFHNIFGSACASKQLVLQHSSGSVTGQPHAHLAALAALPCCREPGLCGDTAGPVPRGVAELHAWPDGLLLTWPLALRDSPPLMCCFREGTPGIL